MPIWSQVILESFGGSICALIGYVAITLMRHHRDTVRIDKMAERRHADALESLASRVDEIWRVLVDQPPTPLSASSPGLVTRVASIERSLATIRTSLDTLTARPASARPST